MSAVTLTNVRNALYTTLTDQVTATPTQLRKAFRYRPGGLSEKPCAWLGDFTDDLGYDAGTRSRSITGEIIVADTFRADLVTDADPFDGVRDGLMERFTQNANMCGGTSVTEMTRIADSEITLQSADGSSVIYRGMILSVLVRIWEGRD